MKVWHLQCVDRATGQETVEVIPAANERDAVGIASNRGLMVGKVLRVDPPQPDPTPVRAVFSVQTIDRQTGRENWVRVEASSRQEAQRRVTDLGEVVGDCHLIEVVKDEKPSQPAPPGTPTDARGSIPGVVVCPNCAGHSWTGGRGCLVWALVILLFPIGLLLLFLKPTWRCAKCGYSYSSYTTPTDLGGNEAQPHRVLPGVLLAIFVALLAIAVVLAVAGR